MDAILILGYFILFLIATILAYFFAIPFLFGAPYDISRKKALKNIIKLTNPKKGDLIAELGSGDGRICIELAKRGAEVHGFEFNIFLVWLSRRKIKKLGLENRIKIYWGNFFMADLSKYNKIVFFQFKSITKKLGEKLKKELKRGSLVISHQWKIPDWKIKKKLGKFNYSYVEVYLYGV